jgi:hypothetical protein
VTLPEGISQNDVEDPDNMGNMTCMSYIERRLAEQQAKVQHYATEGIRLPPEEKDRLMALTRQKGAIAGSINSGKLTEDKYKEYMQKQLAKDAKLLALLDRLGLAKKA